MCVLCVVEVERRGDVYFFFVWLIFFCDILFNVSGGKRVCNFGVFLDWIMCFGRIRSKIFFWLYFVYILSVVVRGERENCLGSINVWVNMGLDFFFGFFFCEFVDSRFFRSIFWLMYSVISIYICIISICLEDLWLWFV